MAENPLITTAPDYILPSNEGFENVDTSSLSLPRVVLMQGLSPAVTEGSAKAGEVWDSLGGKVADKEKAFCFIPIFHYLQAIEWGVRASQEGILQTSTDPKNPLFIRAKNREKTMKNGKEEYAITLYHNFIVILPPNQALMCLSCSRTNYKHGNTLLTMARYRGNYPLYAGRYTAQSKFMQSKGNAFYNWDFTNAGWATKDEIDCCRTQYLNIKAAFDSQKLNVDIEGDKHETEDNPNEVAL